MAGIEIDGIDEVLRKLGQLEDQGKRAESAALRSAGDRIKESIQAETPVDEGDLLKSINRSNVKTKEGVKQVEVGPDSRGKRSHVARFLEFGTVKMKANPFMSRGYEQARAETLAIIARELRKGLGL